MSKILVSGLATLDCLYSVPGFSAAAEKFVATDQQWEVGGGAANAALCIQRLRSSALLLSRVGDDFGGQLIQNRLQQQGVDCSALQVIKGAQSSSSSILLDPQGERQIVNFRGDFSDGEKLTSHSIANNLTGQRFDAVLSDNRWLAGNTAALQLARTQGVPGVLDAEPPYCAELVSLATHIAFSAAGLVEFTGIEEPTSALQVASCQLDSWVCVTHGEQGVWAIDHGTVRHFPAFAVTAVDTLGAGDVWHGAFSQQLASGQTESQAIRLANATAALKCTRKGGGSVSPSMHEVEQLLLQGSV